MRRTLCVLALLLVLPAAAVAQTSDPFTPPQVPIPTTAAPRVTPTPPPNQNRIADPDEEPSRGLLLGVAGIVALLLAGIAFYITRDARRNLTDADKRAIEREGQGPTRLSPEERKKRNRAKAAQRKRDRRQRQARKANRPR